MKWAFGPREDADALQPGESDCAGGESHSAAGKQVEATVAGEAGEAGRNGGFCFPKQLLGELKSKMESDSAAMFSLSELVQRIQRFTEEAKLLPPQPLDVLSFFEDLQIDYSIEYYRYKLFQLLPWTLQPSIEHAFKDWNPLEVGYAMSLGCRTPIPSSSWCNTRRT